MDQKDRDIRLPDSERADSERGTSETADSDDDWPLPDSYPHIVSFDDVLARAEEAEESDDDADGNADDAPVPSPSGEG